MNRALAFAALLAAPASAAPLARLPAVEVRLAPVATAASAESAASLSSSRMLEFASSPAFVAPVVGRTATALSPSVPRSFAPARVEASYAAPVAPALPALKRAAVDAPENPEKSDQAAPTPVEPESPEKQVEAGRAVFDGSVAAPEAPVVDASIAAPSVGSGLVPADSADAEWLESLVKTLATTRTGRRVLRDIAKLAAKRGHPTMVVVKPISNNGEFRYDSDLLVMDAKHLKRDPTQVAAIFAHELQHVLQRDWKLPVDALELEVESYTVENRVWTELGVEPEAGSFARMARKRLLKDPDAFFQWLGEQYKNNRLLHGDSLDGYVAWLEAKLPVSARRIARAEKDIRAAKRVIEKMRVEGKPEEAIQSFVQDDLQPAERRLRGALIEKAWIEGDIALLSTEDGRARYRDYARGVIRRARALSRSASRI